MKKLIFTFMMCVFSIALHAQTTRDSYNVENTTKDELWRRAKDFCLSRHEFTLNTTTSDKEIGVMVFNVEKEDRHFSAYSELSVGFTAKVKIENNKYSVEVYDGIFSLKPTSQAMGDISFMPSKILEDIKDELTFIKDTYDDKTIDQLKTSLSVYKKMQSENPKYKKPKDEKKGKVDYWWSYYQKKIDRIERVIDNYGYAISDFRHDLLIKMFNVNE